MQNPNQNIPYDKFSQRASYADYATIPQKIPYYYASQNQFQQPIQFDRNGMPYDLYHAQGFYQQDEPIVPIQRKPVIQQSYQQMQMQQLGQMNQFPQEFYGNHISQQPINAQFVQYRLQYHEKSQPERLQCQRPQNVIQMDTRDTLMIQAGAQPQFQQQPDAAYQGNHNMGGMMPFSDYQEAKVHAERQAQQAYVQQQQFHPPMQYPVNQNARYQGFEDVQLQNGNDAQYDRQAQPHNGPKINHHQGPQNKQISQQQAAIMQTVSNVEKQSTQMAQTQQAQKIKYSLRQLAFEEKKQAETQQQKNFNPLWALASRQQQEKAIQNFMKRDQNPNKRKRWQHYPSSESSQSQFIQVFGKNLTSQVGDDEKFQEHLISDTSPSQLGSLLSSRHLTTKMSNQLSLRDLRGQGAILTTEVSHKTYQTAFKFGNDRPRNKNLVTSASQFLPPIIEDGSNSLSGGQMTVQTFYGENESNSQSQSFQSQSSKHSLKENQVQFINEKQSEMSLKNTSKANETGILQYNESQEKKDNHIMMTHGEKPIKKNSFFSPDENRSFQTEAHRDDYKDLQFKHLFTVGDDYDSSDPLSGQADKPFQRTKTQLMLDDSDEHNSIQRLIKNIGPQLSQIRFRASIESIQLSDNQSTLEMKKTDSSCFSKRLNEQKENFILEDLGQPVYEQQMPLDGNTVHGLAINKPQGVTDILNTAFLNDCNCSDDEQQSSMINTAREKLLQSSLTKSAIKPITILPLKPSEPLQPLAKPSSHIVKVTSEEAITPGYSQQTNSFQLPELKLSLFDYNRDTREEIKQPAAKKSRDLIRHYENLPQEISDIIISQNLKIDNLRYQVLELQGQNKFMMQQMSIMQENYANNTSQLNLQIQVMMEALNLLLNHAGNDEESFDDLSNKQGCQGAKKHEERPVHLAPNRDVQQEINSARQQLQQVIAFNKHNKKIYSPKIAPKQETMLNSKKPVYRT